MRFPLQGLMHVGSLSSPFAFLQRNQRSAWAGSDSASRSRTAQQSGCGHFFRFGCQQQSPLHFLEKWPCASYFHPHSTAFSEKMMEGEREADTDCGSQKLGFLTSSLFVLRLSGSAAQIHQPSCFLKTDWQLKWKTQNKSRHPSRQNNKLIVQWSHRAALEIAVCVSVSHYSICACFECLGSKLCSAQIISSSSLCDGVYPHMQWVGRFRGCVTACSLTISLQSSHLTVLMGFAPMLHSLAELTVL